jgi:hypothetical protein
MGCYAHVARLTELPDSAAAAADDKASATAAAGFSDFLRLLRGSRAVRTTELGTPRVNAARSQTP